MQVLVRLDKSTASKLEKVARALGVSKAEVMRRALKRYLAEEANMTVKMKGIVKSRLSLEELERIYQVDRD